ncbi:FAD-binding oxidoreductase [Microbispora corallina]|uniref:FAD-linked oxidase n=1 Tax=Microbispora corallina TaxID=83302 RepID=A0ABQ4G7G0_9ACTN|nr:FAD-binding oxidoreductase [Microbispora corallina]GIH42969.1 FAD-linked oxidase [Microbispora corallina]
MHPEIALRTLADGFDGEVILPQDAGYESARRVWNQSIDRKPTAIARCRTRDDAVAALALARETGLELAVRGGGHGFPGFSTTEGGLVLDLGPMKQIAVDAGRRTAVVGPGVRWGELAAAAARHGLAPVGGHVADVGVAGLTLGGGNGWFSRIFGLACDNLVAADVLTASGRVVRASADENEDLFWGLRGGGGNLGIVLEFTLRLHPVDLLLAGMVLHRLDDAADVLRFLSEYGAGAPDEVNVAAAVLAAPPAPFVPEELHGRPVLALAMCHVGPLADGERALAAVRGAGRPFADLVEPTTFEVLQHMFDAQGRPTPYHMRSHLGGRLTGDLIDAVVEAGGGLTSPDSGVLLLPMGGAAGRVATDATAFRHREASYCLEIGAAWRAGDEDPRRHADWADRTWAATRSWATGVEVNHLGDEGPEGVRRAYGDNYDRLARIKRTWDPENLFRLNQNVPPA